MARLSFNAYGYMYQKNLKSIRDAYDATIKELDRRHTLAIGEGEKYRRAVEAGLKPEFEYDGDAVLYAYAELYKVIEEEAEAALPIARQAYVVILHHHWEKWCKGALKQKSYKAREAYALLSARGLDVDVDGLERLRTRRTTSSMTMNSAWCSTTPRWIGFSRR